MKQTRRKKRRAMEQAAIEALYWLCEERSRFHGGVLLTGQTDASQNGVYMDSAFAVLDDAIDDYGRFFRCPRCGGHGDDPVQNNGPSFANPMGEPPDPCGLCNGHGTYGPRGHMPPGYAGQNGEHGSMEISFDE
jgi:hypothetical protein